MTIEFLITCLVVVLVPGTGVLYTVSAGLTRGRAAATWAAAGCTLGIVPHLLASAAGLSAIMHTSALAFEVLRWAGVLYLFYIAIMTWRNDDAFALDGGTTGNGRRQIVLRAALLNLLNPKLTIFFLAFLPQFVDPARGPAFTQMLALSGVFMAMTFAVFVIYGCLAHAFRRHVVSSPRVQTVLRQGFAGLFAALGVRLAIGDSR